jgi:hypothetical protein
MNFLMAAILACAPQEGAEAFRVISEWVDAPDNEKAKKLAPFYREFLESELKAKRDLGRLFGAAPRIRLNGKRTLLEHFEEIKRLGGNPTFREIPAPRETFDLDLEAWPIEALALLSERAGRNPTQFSPWLDPMVHAYPLQHTPKPPPKPAWFFYRNVAVRASSVGWRKVVEFSGNPSWTAGLTFQVLTDPQLPAVRCLNPRLIEAIDENGRRIEATAGDATSLPGYTDESGWNPPMAFGFHLAVEGTTKIARLRLAFTILVPTEVRRYEATEFDPAKPVATGDEHFSVVFTMQEGRSADEDCVTARVIPKQVRHADLVDIPIMLYSKFDRPGPSGQMTRFTGKGDGTIVTTRWCTKRPADQVPARLVEAYRGVRRPLRAEIAVPVGLKERTIYAEFRDIPLR